MLIDGIYKRGKKYYLRERIENIQSIGLEDEDDISIPVTNPCQLTEEKLVIIDVLVTEITEKSFLNKNNQKEFYERIKGISNSLQITLHNYNKNYFQKLLVGKPFRFFFVKSRFFNNNLYFTMTNNSSFISIKY